jgi:hypothetical protein
LTRISTPLARTFSTVARLAAVRLVATTGIASIAAYVSYFHMASVVSRYGERTPNPYLLPLSVDGLVVVASISLVELAGRIRAAETAALPTSAAAHIAVAVPYQQAPAPVFTTDRADRTVVAQPTPAVAAEPGTGPGTTPAADPAAVGQAPADQSVDAQAPLDSSAACQDDGDGPPADPAAAVAWWRSREPNLSLKELADKVGRSTRTVRRILDRLQHGDPDELPSADAARGVNRIDGMNGVNGKTVPGLVDAVTSR